MYAVPPEHLWHNLRRDITRKLLRMSRGQPELHIGGRRPRVVCAVPRGNGKVGRREFRVSAVRGGHLLGRKRRYGMRRMPRGDRKWREWVRIRRGVCGVCPGEFQPSRGLRSLRIVCPRDVACQHGLIHGLRCMFSWNVQRGRGVRVRVGVHALLQQPVRAARGAIISQLLHVRRRDVRRIVWPV
jgi:hypothetical protein